MFLINKSTSPKPAARTNYSLSSAREKRPRSLKHQGFFLAQPPEGEEVDKHRIVLMAVVKHPSVCRSALILLPDECQPAK